jgi:hypothetical protein
MTEVRTKILQVICEVHNDVLKYGTFLAHRTISGVLYGEAFKCQVSATNRLFWATSTRKIIRMSFFDLFLSYQSGMELCSQWRCDANLAEFMYFASCNDWIPTTWEWVVFLGQNVDSHTFLTFWYYQSHSIGLAHYAFPLPGTLWQLDARLRRPSTV